MSTSIYDNIESMALNVDMQSWSSSKSPIFQRLIDETKPQTIIEVGSWKGVSAINMAQLSTKYGAHIYCVDTWLGSLEHMLRSDDRDYNWKTLHGYPLLYWQFLTNVKHSGYHPRITPVPNTSLAVAPYLLSKGIKADLIYIDGDHTEHGCFVDISIFRPLLRDANSVIFGDDYTNFPTVRAAVDRYAKENNLKVEVDEPHWVLRKP